MLDLLNTSALTTLGFIPGIPGGLEWVVILVVALLLFGRRLPEVGANLAKTIVGFKREINTMTADVDEAASKPAPSQPAQIENTDTRTVAQGSEEPAAEPAEKQG